MSSTDTASAAAALTTSVLGEFVEKHGDDNAARMLAEMPGQPAVAPPAQPVVSTPAPAAEAAPVEVQVEIDGQEVAQAAVEELEAEVQLPSFDPVPDDELDRLLEEPDYDNDALAEVEAAVEAGDEFDDPQAEARLRAAQKRIDFLEGRLATSDRKKWAAENLRKYPLLATYASDEVNAIQATSRRAFAREAAQLHERFARVAQPMLADIAALKAGLKGDATLEARTEVRKAWGNPAVEPAGSGTADAQIQTDLEAARARRAPLAERIKILAGIKPQGG